MTPASSSLFLLLFMVLLMFPPLLLAAIERDVILMLLPLSCWCHSYGPGAMLFNVIWSKEMTIDAVSATS